MYIHNTTLTKRFRNTGSNTKAYTVLQTCETINIQNTSANGPGVPAMKGEVGTHGCHLQGGDWQLLSLLIQMPWLP